MEEFSRIIGHRTLLLDVGGGESPYKTLFKYEKYISLDIDKSKQPDIVGDICNIPFDDNTIDLVICTEVLEHVEDTDKALTELNRVLSEDCYLILTTPLLIGVSRFR
jgi:SAM-dependent methyltransferase